MRNTVWNFFRNQAYSYMYIIALELKYLEEWPSLEYGYGDGFFRWNKYDGLLECWVKELEVLHVIFYMAMYWLSMTVRIWM